MAHACYPRVPVETWILTTVQSTNLARLVCVLLGGVLSAARSPDLRLSNVLDRVERGDTPALRDWLGQSPDSSTTSYRIQRESKAWISAAGPASIERRRLIVATVALEAAYAKPKPSPPQHDEDAPKVPDPRVLIEWACTLVRQNVVPYPAERYWHWLVIAIMEGKADHVPLEVHVRHALERFPAEPRFVLARAVAAELRTWPEERGGRSPADRTNATDTLIARLQAATELESVRAEATLRLGHLFLRLGRVAAARERFQLVIPLTSDPYLLYLVNLFDGRAFEQLDRPMEAIAAYRAAAAAVPHAQSADFALAAALARYGDRAEAVRVGFASITSEPSGVDPWRGYGQADVRFTREIVDGLRRELWK